MEIRPEPRFEERIPCQVMVAGSSFRGTVLNLSWSGLFVETAGRADPGSQVWLELRPESRIPCPTSIRVATQVVWSRVGIDAGPMDGFGGVGLRIETASEQYYDFLLGVAARPSDG